MNRWWLFCFVALLCAPAALPYLSGDIPRTNDVLAHYYRAAELSWLLKEGLLFPRWAPDLAHGYGYPIFNFFAYFAHYLVAAFNLIFGVPLLWGLRLSFVAAFVSSGLGASALARDLSEGNDEAGLVAAVGYAYSPYALYTAHVRGSLPENLAMALLPFAFWALRRALLHAFSVQSTPSRRLSSLAGVANFNLALAIVFIAGFVLMHSGMALQYLPLLGVFGIAISLLHAPRQWAKAVAVLALAFAASLALTAFLWLPVIAELRFVNFDIAFARAGLIYVEHFATPTELFTFPSLPISTALLNPPVVRPLPVLAIVVALFGLMRLRHLGATARANFVFAGAVSLGAISLTLGISQPLWDSFGLLRQSAFPWRFIGPATLFATLLAGMAFTAFKIHPEWRTIGALALTGIIIASALPFLFPPREFAPLNPTRADLARFEIPPLLVGTTTTGEYTPIWVKEFPDTREQQQQLIEGVELERLDIAQSPPARTAVEVLSRAPAHDTYRIMASAPLVATYGSFYFPGWQATLNGAPAPITVTYPHGLIAVRIPAGKHTLDLRFGSTPVRGIAEIISGITLALLLLAAWQLRAQFRVTSSPTEIPLTPAIISAAVMAATLVAIAALITTPAAPTMQHTLNANFGDELTLLGYSPRQVGNRTEVTLAWQAQHPIGAAYGMNLRLVDDDGLVWSDTNIERPRDWRYFPGTDHWSPDSIVFDSYVLKPLPGTPPGDYHLEVIVYRADTLQALSVQRIGAHTITRPAQLPLAPALADFDGIALIGVAADRASAAPGDPYRLIFDWQAATAPLANQSLQLDLIDSFGQTVLSLTQPISPRYLPSRWQTGDVLKQSVFFRLPAALPGGTYHWRVNRNYTVSNAPLLINAPGRTFETPPLQHELNIRLAEVVVLTGYNTAVVGNDISVELVWRALTEMNEPYRVFLHLIDADGLLVSQSDGEPANWTRPTTGWLTGEVIADRRTLTAPGAGEYTLAAGLIDSSGNRLVSAAAPDGVIRLGHLEIAP